MVTLSDCLEKEKRRRKEKINGKLAVSQTSHILKIFFVCWFRTNDKKTTCFLSVNSKKCWVSLQSEVIYYPARLPD